MNRKVVVNEDLVTSRKADDIPAFNRRMIEVFSQEHPRPRDAARDNV